ncbi:MAG: MaoC family dehydratase [Solirubrobacteraceae bacterium]
MGTPMYYEDWEIDRIYETASRPVTQELAERFGEIEGAQSPLHLDEEYARTQSVFGRLTVHGLLTVSMAAGMMGEMGMFDGTALAFLELSWKYHEPVCVGDTISVRWWVSEKRPTSRPERGVVVRSIEVVNQDDVKVCSGTMTTLWSRREARELLDA